MRTVYKYPIHGAPGDTVIIKMPEGAKILHFATQRGQPCLWAEVYSQNPLCDWLFTILGTGWPFPEGKDWHHVGTILQYAEDLVWHLYEDVGYDESGAKL